MFTEYIKRQEVDLDLLDRFVLLYTINENFMAGDIICPSLSCTDNTYEYPLMFKAGTDINVVVPVSRKGMRKINV